jgi:putative transposase
LVGGARVPRAPRYFIDGAYYHVYGRIARRERVFAREGEASRFVDVVRDVKKRDGLTILAWCVMANHYHLAVRTATVPLWRSIRLVQWRYAREHNRRRRQLGPLWQGRYQVRLVEDQRYLLQLIAYIHLNPVAAGLVEDPRDYAWSGHRKELATARRCRCGACHVRRSAERGEAGLCAYPAA